MTDRGINSPNVRGNTQRSATERSRGRVPQPHIEPQGDNQGVQNNTNPQQNRNSNPQPRPQGNRFNNQDNINSNQDSNNNKQDNRQNNKRQKVKKPKTLKQKVIIGVVSGLISVGILISGVYVYKSYTTIIKVDYKESGMYALDNYLEVINNGDLDSLYNDSWVKLEQDYANADELKLNFIKLILRNVSFKYPQVEAYTRRGQALDSNGNVILRDSDMLNNEKFTVSHIDYETLAERFLIDKETIVKMYKDAKLDIKSFTFSDDMVNLFLKYVLTLNEEKLPLKEDEISIPLVKEDLGKDKGYVMKVSDDTELDRLLFSSKEFHKLLDTFSKIAVEFDNKNIITIDIENPEYREWEKKRDEGKLTETDIEPPKTIQKREEKEGAYIEQSIIPYTWVGSYYIQNEYKEGKIEIQTGDGTFERPLALGSTIVTKVIATDGKAYDIKLTFDKAYRDEEAIQYVLSRSEKNRGIDINSSIDLVVIEYTVTNISDTTITIKDDMCLCDKDANKSGRTGKMFGLTDTLTLASGETKSMQSWQMSQSIDGKYIVWGKSFNREYPVIWLKVLQGEMTGIESSTQ